MKTRIELDYDTVLSFVRSYGTAEPPYDVVGVVHLLLAALDNLREQRFDEDHNDLARCTTEEQRQYLIRIGEFLREWTESE